MNKERLEIPCAYQGGKTRIASKILKHINVNKNDIFVDMCCGSGSVSIELINNGFNPQQIWMCDKAPFGKFWEMIGKGDFNLSVFEKWINRIPQDINKIQSFMNDLSKQEISQDVEDFVYIYLLLQSASFGSKQIWHTDGKWRNCSFRSYWLPTATSSRRSPVNPMMPMPKTLFNRVRTISEKMHGINGFYGDISDFKIPENAILYIDPPYKNTTKYGYTVDITSYCKSVKNKTFVSEAVPLSDNFIVISEHRTKGGISGDRKTTNDEFLSMFN